MPRSRRRKSRPAERKKRARRRSTKKKNLIVLDLDASMIHSLSPREMKQMPPSRVAHFSRTKTYDYTIFHRPHLQEFLDYIFDRFYVGVWSAGDTDYVEEIVKYIILSKPGRKLEFVLSAPDCDRSEKLYNNLKDLRMIWENAGHTRFNIDRVLIIDDYNHVVKPQRCNTIHIPAFNVLKRGSEKDDTLLKVKQHLKKYTRSRSMRDIHDIQ